MERVNATDLVVAFFKKAIQTGELKAGDKLPKEADIAQKLGVGRSSLREGIKILNAYGVVESRQGEGTFIVDNKAEKVFDFLSFMPTKENQLYFLELRRVIEVGNIITIYNKLTSEDLSHLQKQVDVLGGENLLSSYVAADKEFHSYLICFSKNPMIMQISDMLADMRTDLLERLFTHKSIVKDAYEAHTNILNALRKKDMNACVKSVTDHLDITTSRVTFIHEEKK